MFTWDNYLEVITKRLMPYFDLSKDEKVAGKQMNLVARFNMRNEKYFFIKNITLFAYENHETVLVRRESELTEETAKEFCTYLKKAVTELVNPNDEHMSSVVTGILVATEGITPKARKVIESFHYSRNFKFLLQGWCDVRLLAVDLTTCEVYSNRAGRPVREAYRVPKGKEVQGETCSASMGSMITKTIL